MAVHFHRDGGHLAVVADKTFERAQVGAVQFGMRLNRDQTGGIGADIAHRALAILHMYVHDREPKPQLENVNKYLKYQQNTHFHQNGTVPDTAAFETRARV
jgi:hypothetical protein